MEDLDSQRMRNLHFNYVKWKAAKIGESILPNGQQIDIMLQKRDNGTVAYYAVIKPMLGGKAIPICYVVGHNIRYFGNQNTNSPRKWPRFEIKSLFVDSRYRRQGVALAVYSAIISSGIILISDTDRNKGSLGLWSKLEQSQDIARVIQHYQVNIAFPYFSQRTI